MMAFLKKQQQPAAADAEMVSLVHDEVRRSLQSELDAARARRDAALLKIEQLKAEMATAEVYPRAQESTLEGLQWQADRAARALDDRDTRFEQDCEELAQSILPRVSMAAAYLERIKQAARGNVENIERAAASNREMIDLVNDARRDLGDWLLYQMLPAALSTMGERPIGIYGGLLMEDLVAAFSNDTTRRLASARSPAALVPALVTAMRRQQSASSAPKARPATVQPFIRPRVAEVKSTRPTARVKQWNDPLPDQLGALKPGEVRVSVVQSGYPNPITGKPCQAGLKVILPAKIAQMAEDNGAVTVIERAAASSAISEDYPHA
jgi:hypothetical protein